MKPLFAVLLRLYPAAFRRRYREELLAAFDAESGQVAGQGLRLRLMLWRHLLADLVASASRQRVRQLSTALRDVLGLGTPRLPVQSRRGFMETLLQDLRYAARQFARRPGFTAIAVISLALGIGGNSLIFGMLDGFVFNPFHYPEPDRLVAVGVSFPKVSADTTYVEALSPAEYGDIRDGRSFAHIAAFDMGNRNVSGGDVPERVFTAFLLDDLFPVLQMKPALGRGFTAEELAPRGPNVAVISHRLWQSRFGGDPAIVNRSIRIGGQATTVVGVMPPGLVLIGTDLWIPWGADVAAVPRNARQFTILARLAPGIPLKQAEAELSSIAAGVHQRHGAQYKEYDGWRLVPTPWAAALMQDMRGAAFVVLVAVGLVLLIACANLTNLMLARSTTRQRELAVRLALGAARWRVAQQLLTESLLLSLAGAAAGLLLAYIGFHFAGALVPAQFATLDLHVGINARVLLWSAALAIGAGLLVGVLPAIQATRTDPQESLKTDARAGAGRAGSRVRQALVVAEISLSVVLLIGAGLMMRTFSNIQRVEPGFEARGVLTMRMTLPQQKYPTGQAITAFFDEVTRRVEGIPGVVAAGFGSQFPPIGPFSSQVEVDGAVGRGSMLPTANTTVVSRRFFETLQIPLMRGRAFGVEDHAGTPGRVVVNQAFAARYLADRDPLGARVRMIGRGGPGPWAEVIGVVGDARNSGITAPTRPEVFISMEAGRDIWNQLFLLVRSDRTGHALLPDIRAAIASIDPEQPVYAIQTLDEALATSSFQQRTSMILGVIFAGVALVLAGVGIYGVMSYTVSARTQEIGVRMAVGAGRSDVVRLVLAQVARLTAVGLAIGVGLLMLGGKALSQLLYEVKPADPLTIALVTMTLGSVALFAAWIPARRASRIDPIRALRHE